MYSLTYWNLQLRLFFNGRLLNMLFMQKLFIIIQFMIGLSSLIVFFKRSLTRIWILWNAVKLTELTNILKVINLREILLFKETSIKTKILILKCTNKALQNIRDLANKLICKVSIEDAVNICSMIDSSFHRYDSFIVFLLYLPDAIVNYCICMNAFIIISWWLIIEI